MTKTLGILGLIVALVAACARPAAPGSANAGRLKVVATFSILGEWVQTVGGDKVDVQTLVGPGRDTHEFAPSPIDAAALAEAALVFENGSGFEMWLDDLYAASGSNARRVAVTGNVTPIEVDGGRLDPHVWHDVTNAIRMVEMIRDALAEADPGNVQTYQANAAAYVTQLRNLDAWVSEQVNSLPEERRKLVTSHDTFQYFAARYGFEIVGTALGSISTEVADPPAGEIAQLVADIKAAGIPAIFAENVSNPKLMEQIASEAGVALAPPLYTDALGVPGSDADTYLKMIRYNVTTIVTALSR